MVRVAFFVENLAEAVASSMEAGSGLSSKKDPPERKIRSEESSSFKSPNAGT